MQSTHKLTWAERNDRRRQMAAAVRSGKTIGEVANQFEVTTQTVRQAVEQFKSVAMTNSADPAAA